MIQTGNRVIGAAGQNMGDVNTDMLKARVIQLVKLAQSIPTRW
jgi:hypothetical protein